MRTNIALQHSLPEGRALHGLLAREALLSPLARTVASASKVGSEEYKEGPKVLRHILAKFFTLEP